VLGLGKGFCSEWGWGMGTKRSGKQKAVVSDSRAKRLAAGTAPGGFQRRSVPLPKDYAAVLEDIKSRIRNSQVRAVVSANRELIILYWEIGRCILEHQKKEGWGTKVVERLGRDLRAAFPDMRGFSPRNLKYMRSFADTYPDQSIVQQLVAQIPWGHNVILLERVKDSGERQWYLQRTLEHGWSRSMLLHWIDSDLYARQGKAVTNFKAALPAPQSDLAEQTLKDPYVFDFLTMDAEARERDLEQGLLDHIRRFLLELGAGFAFVGQQVHLEVDGEDFYVDLLFYHLELRCFVVIDLKVQPFKAEFAGKMNFYLSAVDDLLRHPGDKPSIGIILCKIRSKIVAEYALRDLAKPVGVARYVTKVVEALPAEFKGSLPTIKQIETELKRAPKMARDWPGGQSSASKGKKRAGSTRGDAET